METNEIIKNFYCSCNHCGNLLVINEDKQRKHHNRPIYINGYSGFNAASFIDMAHLERSIEEFSLDIDLVKPCSVHYNDLDGKTTIYKCFNNFYNPYFWSINELPEGCKKIKGYSNGSIVDCYFLKNGLDIIVFRPNPNATNIYNPMSLDDLIKFNRAGGTCF